MEVVSFVDVPYHGWHFNGRNLVFFQQSGKNQENTGKNWLIPVKTASVLKTVLTCLLYAGLQ